MNREEILAKSRKENKERDPYQLEIDNKACKLALGIIILFSAIIYALNIFTGKGILAEMFAPVAIINAVLYTSRHVHAEEKNKATLFLMIGWLFAAVLLVITAFVKALS
ncbi:MAG: hypothetical protein IJ007_06515 [Oscillospiraceae bacterium]|nr:hypothetical protein [Oscillospiraceae bacterium]